MNWLDKMARVLERETAVARVVIVGTDGPTPRAVGSSMLVWRDGREGKVGRSDLEERVVAEARALLGEQSAARSDSNAIWQRELLQFSTGEVLGQASGGAIDVLVELFGRAELRDLLRAKAKQDGDAALVRLSSAGAEAQVLGIARHNGRGPEDAALTTLASDVGRQLVRVAAPSVGWLIVERLASPLPTFYVYGTGLVARALVKLLADLPFQVQWIDTAPGRFPENVPVGVTTLACEDMAVPARRSKAGGFHAVMTSRHELDLEVAKALCEAQCAAFIGVIGSGLKRERMFARLRQSGVGDGMLASIVCPIGLPEIRSKVPEVIAIGIAAQALGLLYPGDAAHEASTAT